MIYKVQRDINNWCWSDFEFNNSRHSSQSIEQGTILLLLEEKGIYVRLMDKEGKIYWIPKEFKECLENMEACPER
jgi:hypothetical protein